MQTLSNVDFEIVRVGDRVRSKLTLNEGFVSKKIPIEEASRREDNEFVIKWDNGNISLNWHFFHDKIWLL